MRPSALMDAIAAQIEAIDPADTQSAVDRFARVTGRQSEDALNGRRLFALRWSDPLPTIPADTSIGCARYAAGLELVIAYADTAAGQGRLGDDSEKIATTLAQLSRTIPAANIANLELSANAETGSIEGAALATYTITLEFTGG